ncbi:integrase core domain-containing protein [Streptomyces sp. NPDC048663]|uniref:integrase core domain-containing protein n=1 Tax=Streptomyces sp. NPDC048663 TaxID=3155638 RepID=UPI0034394EBB
MSNAGTSRSPRRRVTRSLPFWGAILSLRNWVRAAGASWRESLQGRWPWDTAREVHLDFFRWLDRYNTVRRHSGLGYRSPITYERAIRTTALAKGPKPVSQDPESSP